MRAKKRLLARGSRFPLHYCCGGVLPPGGGVVVVFGGVVALGTLVPVGVHGMGAVIEALDPLGVAGDPVLVDPAVVEDPVVVEVPPGPTWLLPVPTCEPGVTPGGQGLLTVPVVPVWPGVVVLVVLGFVLIPGVPCVIPGVPPVGGVVPGVVVCVPGVVLVPVPGMVEVPGVVLWVPVCPGVVITGGFVCVPVTPGVVAVPGCVPVCDPEELPGAVVPLVPGLPVVWATATPKARNKIDDARRCLGIDLLLFVLFSLNKL